MIIKEINKSKLIHGLYSLCYVLDCLLKLIGTTSLNFGGWHDRISLKDIYKCCDGGWMHQCLL